MKQTGLPDALLTHHPREELGSKNLHCLYTGCSGSQTRGPLLIGLVQPPDVMLVGCQWFPAASSMANCPWQNDVDPLCLSDDTVLAAESQQSMTDLVPFGLESVSPSIMSDSLQPRRLCPWNSLGKNTGVGSHSLLQGLFLTQGLNCVNLCIAGRFFTI